MKYVEAPNNKNLEELPRPWIFLAGGISDCPDWQAQVVEELKNEDCTLFNPRRADFPYEIPEEVQKQISWEFSRLQEVDLVAFWFAKETIQPIVLYELGFALGKMYGNGGSQAIIISCHPDYPRITDVLQQTINVDPVITQLITYSLEDYIKIIRQAVNVYHEMENGENAN